MITLAVLAIGFLIFFGSIAKEEWNLVRQEINQSLGTPDLIYPPTKTTYQPHPEWRIVQKS